MQSPTIANNKITHELICCFFALLEMLVLSAPVLIAPRNMAGQLELFQVEGKSLFKKTKKTKKKLNVITK